ncbi:hypothetical protein HDV01_004472 [Terramyces sp. JEL0728]|nr:hypothetical protein HDV01_004472 [Terramyces sp. JEL0728]
MEQLQPYLNQANHHLSRIPLLVTLEHVTRINKVYICLVTYFLFSISIFFEIFAPVSTGILAFYYPVFAFLSAYGTDDLEELKEWGLYLGLLGLWTVTENRGILSVIPFYYVIKTGIVGWLVFGKGMDQVSAFLKPHIYLLFREQKKKQ